MITQVRPRVDLSARLAVVRVEGADAQRFLNAQLSCAVAPPGGDGCYGAYLSPQGRVLATLYVVPAGARYCLLLHSSLVGDLIARLRRYVLRDQVTLDAAPALAVSGSGRSAPESDSIELARLPVAETPQGRRVELPDGRRIWVGSAPGRLSAEDWWRSDLELGIAAVERATSDRHIAQALGLDRIGAVSFTKGCYPGQEIVARVHYRGRAKRGLWLLRAEAELAPASAVVDAAGSAAGELISEAADGAGGYLYLAVLIDGAGPELFAGGAPLTPVRSFET